VGFPFPDHHGLTEPALDTQPVLGLPCQLADGVQGPELRHHSPQGVLLGDSLSHRFRRSRQPCPSWRTPARRSPDSRPATLVDPQQRLRGLRHSWLRDGALQAIITGRDSLPPHLLRYAFRHSACAEILPKSQP